MSEAQSLHHQAFLYLRDVYGDNSRLIDLTQGEALHLYHESAAAVTGTYLSSDSPGAQLEAIAGAFVQGEPPTEIAERLALPAETAQDANRAEYRIRQVRQYVADLALRVTSVYREQAWQPRIPQDTAQLRHDRYFPAPGELLPLEEQNRLFDILHEEELRRKAEEQDDQLPPPSRINMTCRARIAESYVYLAKNRAAGMHEHYPHLDDAALEETAYVGLMIAIENYSRLPDRWGFAPYAEETIRFRLLKEVSYMLKLHENEESRESATPSLQIWTDYEVSLAELEARSHRLQTAVLFLTPWQAVVLRARAGMGEDELTYSVQELATRYDVPEKNIRATYKAAVAQLRRIIPLLQHNALDLAEWRREFPQRKNVFIFLALTGESPSYETPLPVLYEQAAEKLDQADLSDGHRDVIERLYGLRGGIPETAGDLAKERDVTNAAVTSMERRILQKMGINVPTRQKQQQGDQK